MQVAILVQAWGHFDEKKTKLFWLKNRCKSRKSNFTALFICMQQHAAQVDELKLTCA